jgi:hypothetical protein
VVEVVFGFAARAVRLSGLLILGANMGRLQSLPHEYA